MMFIQSANEIYQFSCPGRHRENFVFAGSIVPILNKLFISANISNDPYAARPYRVVRVEASNPSDDPDNADKEVSQEELLDSEDEAEEGVSGSNKVRVPVHSVVGGEEDIGKGVARQSNKTGPIFRGLITKVRT